MGLGPGDSMNSPGIRIITVLSIFFSTTGCEGMLSIARTRGTGYTTPLGGPSAWNRG